MKIGYFTDAYLPKADGIAYSIENFRQAFEAMGHEVYVITARPSLRFKEPSKRIIRLPAIKGLFFDEYPTSLFFPPQVERKLDKIGLDVIHFHTPGQIGMLGAFYALRKQIPLVTTYHTDLYEYVTHYPAVLPGTIALSMLLPAVTGGGMAEFRHSLSSIKPERSVDKWNQKLVERGLTLIHNHCDLVIAPSRKTAKQLKGWDTRSPVVVLPTGVDALATDDRSIAAMRRQLGLNASDDKVILFAGRIGTEKNIGLLITAFETVGARDAEAKLVIVGSGDDLEHYRKQAAASDYADRIILGGLIPRGELGAVYALGAVFAFPSVADTQGLVLNEAAQAGLPIVIVDRDVSEVVKNGDNGYIVRNNAKDLANRLLYVLGDTKRRAAMGRRSHELASGFTIQAQADKLIAQYEHTIKNYAPHTKPTALSRLRDWRGHK